MQAGARPHQEDPAGLGEHLGGPGQVQPAHALQGVGLGADHAQQCGIHVPPLSIQ